MVNINRRYHGKSTGRPKGATTKAPRDPEKIKRIVQLRDNENMHWRQIGKQTDMTHQGPYLLYKRWRGWFYDSS